MAGDRRTPLRPRPTIHDVAAAAGVSRGTVSRVLNGGHWVSPAARVAVEEAIRTTGYRINSHARSLSTRRAHSVAFLLTEPQHLLFEDPNFSVLMRACSDALAPHDTSLVLIMAATADERRRALDFILGGRVDGVLLVSSHAGDGELVRQLRASGVPVVACGTPIGFERTVSHVGADDHDAAARIVAHLQDTGHQHIAMITGPLDSPGGRERLAGYRDAVGEDIDPYLVQHGDWSEDAGHQATARLLAAGHGLDAVFAANDRMAAGAVRCLLERGVDVPGRVAVAGFDDSPVAVQTSPRLTTMRQPFERISIEMVHLLLAELGGATPASLTLPAELVVRESAPSEPAGR